MTALKLTSPWIWRDHDLQSTKELWDLKTYIIQQYPDSFQTAKQPWTGKLVVVPYNYVFTAPGCFTEQAKSLQLADHCLSASLQAGAIGALGLGLANSDRVSFVRPSLHCRLYTVLAVLLSMLLCSSATSVHNPIDSHTSSNKVYYLSTVFCALWCTMRKGKLIVSSWFNL